MDVFRTVQDPKTGPLEHFLDRRRRPYLQLFQLLATESSLEYVHPSRGLAVKLWGIGANRGLAAVEQALDGSAQEGIPMDRANAKVCIATDSS